MYNAGAIYRPGCDRLLLNKMFKKKRLLVYKGDVIVETRCDWLITLRVRVLVGRRGIEHMLCVVFLFGVKMLHI